MSHDKADVRDLMGRHFSKLADLRAGDLTSSEARALARDIYDGWSGWYWSWHWPDRHEDVIAKIGIEAEAQADEMSLAAEVLLSRAKAARALAGACRAATEALNE